MVINVMVQKMMDTAPSTSSAVGSDENTLGDVYSGEVPAELISVPFTTALNGDISFCQYLPRLTMQLHWTMFDDDDAFQCELGPFECM